MFCVLRTYCTRNERFWENARYVITSCRDVSRVRVICLPGFMNCSMCLSSEMVTPFLASLAA